MQYIRIVRQGWISRAIHEHDRLQRMFDLVNQPQGNVLTRFDRHWLQYRWLCSHCGKPLKQQATILDEQEDTFFGSGVFQHHL